MNLALFLFLIGDYFQQIPLVNEPGLTIWRFNRTEEEQYFDPDAELFSNIWGVFIMKLPSNFPQRRLTVGLDPRWGRALYTVDGYKGFRCFGEGLFTEPWDIDGRFPYIFITDQLKKLVLQFEIAPPAQGDSVPQIRFVRYIGLTISGGQTKTFRWPKGIAYSDGGTPNTHSDDHIYVADAIGRKVYKISVATYQVVDSLVGFGLPTDVAVGKTVVGGAVVNTDSIYVLDEGRIWVVYFEEDKPGFRHILPFSQDVNYHLYSIDTDPCGHVFVSTSKDKIYVLEFIDIGGGQIIVDTLDVFPGPPFNKIHDIYVSGNEVIVSERWTDNSGISLYRITQECAPECCKPVVDITWPRRDGQLIIADSVPIKGLAKCKGIGAGCEGYDYLKYWALYIAGGWNPLPEDFAFLAGAPGATDGEDTLCWLRADTFAPGNYTLLLRGVSNDPDESPGEDRVKISIRRGLPTDPTFTYMRKPDGTYWYPMMSIAPMATPVEIGWRIVGPAGKLRFKLSTNNGVSYQNISGWLPPGNLIDDSTYEGSWVWNTPNFPSRKIRLLMEVYDTAGEYSSSCEIAPAIVVVSDVGGITAGNGGRKLALSEDGVMHMVYAIGRIIRDTVNPGLEDIQNTVYYTYSEDLGMSWKPPRLVAPGRDPAIALFDNGSAGMVYLSDKADTLYYRLINKAGNPGRPTALNVGASLYGSPAITIRGGKAYVAAEVYDTLPGSLASARLYLWELKKQGQLTLSAELVPAWRERRVAPAEAIEVPAESVGLDTGVVILINPQGSPSIATDITGRLHLAWDRGSEIWYGGETDMGWAFARVSDSGVLAGDPCLDVHGGNAYITWEEDRRVLVRKYGFVERGFWSPRTDTVAHAAFGPGGWFNHPVIDKGGAVSWAATSVGPVFRGVSLVQYKRETGDWGDGNLISDHPWADHPQLEITPENLTAAWSQGFWEMNPLWSAPFGRFYLGTANLAQENPPFWWVELGDTQPTPYTTHRGGFVVYPTGKRADVDSAYLSYRFPMFEPLESEVWLYLYYEGNEDWRGVSLRVNGQDFGNFWYPNGEAIWARCEPGVADSFLITVNNIGGSEVSLAGIYVYAAKAGKMETQALAGELSGFPLVLSLNAPYPNPAKSKAIISYAIPGQYEGQPLSLRIYDVSGRRRKSLVEEKAEAGVFAVPFTGEGLSGGLYFIVLRVGEEQRVQKLVWAR